MADRIRYTEEIGAPAGEWDEEVGDMVALVADRVAPQGARVYDIREGGAPYGAPYGAMTGYAKRMLRAVRSSAMAPALKDFCLLLLERSFGNAGFAARAGECEPGLWCAFDLAEWATALEVARQNAYRSREQLIALGVVRYEPDPERPGCGRLGWQTDLAQWRPLDSEYRHARYTRQGAGRKSNRLRPVAAVAASESNRLRSPASEEIKPITPDCLSVIKQITLGGFETALVADSDDAKKGTYKKEEYEEGDRDLAVSTDGDTPPMLASEQSERKKPQPQKPRPPKSQKPPRQPRELSPLDAYRVELLRAIEASNGGVKPPNRDREWGAARRFYDWPTGPAEIADVVACYEAQRLAPRWDAEYLSLTALAPTYSAWRNNPDGYRAAIGRKRAAVEGRLTTDRDDRGAQGKGNSNGHRTTGTHGADVRNVGTDDDSKWDDPRFLASVEEWNRSSRANAARFQPGVWEADVAAVEAERVAQLNAAVRADFERKRAERHAARESARESAQAAAQPTAPVAPPRQPTVGPTVEPATDW